MSYIKDKISNSNRHVYASIDGREIAFVSCDDETLKNMGRQPGTGGYWQIGGDILQSPVEIMHIVNKAAAEGKLPAQQMIQNAGSIRKALLEQKSNEVQEALDRRREEIENNPQIPADAKKHLLEMIDAQKKIYSSAIMNGLAPDGRMHSPEIAEQEQKLYRKAEAQAGRMHGIYDGRPDMDMLSDEDLEKELMRRRAVAANRKNKSKSTE